MGRHSRFTEVPVRGLQDAVMAILRDYGDVVYEATEEGLAVAEKVLVAELKAASPRGKTGKFAKAWKGTGKKYKLARYVGNTTSVQGTREKEIALANILEYSTTRGKPFIRDTFAASVDKMAAAVVEEIRKGV